MNAGVSGRSDLPDLLDRIHKDIDQRLEELRPMVEEAQQLEQALAALPEGRPARSSARGGGGSSARSSAARAGTRGRISRAEAEKRRARVLAILSEDPTTKPATLAMMLGTSPGNIYGLLRRLEQQGTLKRKNGRYRVTAQAR